MIQGVSKGLMVVGHFLDSILLGSELHNWKLNCMAPFLDRLHGISNWIYPIRVLESPIPNTLSSFPTRKSVNKVSHSYEIS